MRGGGCGLCVVVGGCGLCVVVGECGWLFELVFDGRLSKLSAYDFI